MSQPQHCPIAWMALLALGLASHIHAAATGPFTPCYGKFFLAAGSGEAGHKDGYFLDADFNQPAGITLSKDQNTLYVADAGNHDLRAVALDAQDQVSTVLGGGEPGDVDGVGAAARLSWPTQVATEADGSALWLLDQDNTALRRLDLKTLALQTIETAPSGLSFTCVTADPKGGIYLVVGTRMVHRASAADPDQLVTDDPILNCPAGRVVVLGQQPYYCSPCSGFMYPMTKEKKFVQVGWRSLTPTACAFSPLFEDGLWKLLFWAPNEGAIKRYDPRDQATYTYVMQDYQGTVLPGPSESLVGLNATSDFRVLFKKQVNVAVGKGGIYYYSEACSSRIIGVDSQLLVARDADANVVRQAEPGKAPNTVRLDVIGPSLTWFWQQYGAEKYFNQNLAFIRELERNLNLESALHGQGVRYEVQAQVNQLGVMYGSPLTYFLEVGDRIKNHQVDQVLICLDPSGLGKELVMFEFNRTVDDLGMLPQQADWVSMNGDQRYKELGPLTRGLIDWVKAHPQESRKFGYFDGAGRFFFNIGAVEMFKYPRLAQFATDLMRKALLRDQALAQKYGAKIAVAILPTRPIVEVGEKGGDEFKESLDGATMDGSIADLCKELGIPCYDADEPMRVVAMSAYPLFIPGDSHYMPRGGGWMASMLARVMTGTIPNVTPDRSQP